MFIYTYLYIPNETGSVVEEEGVDSKPSNKLCKRAISDSLEKIVHIDIQVILIYIILFSGPTCYIRSSAHTHNNNNYTAKTARASHAMRRAF